MKIRHIVALMTVAFGCCIASPPSADATVHCGGVLGQSCGLGANPAAGTFHGLIAVHDEPWVLDLAARSGTRPGCGDCSWSIVLACATSSPNDPSTQRACAAASNSGVCHRRQLLYRIYLTTEAVTDAPKGTICLGGGHNPIPVGDRAASDVQHYLKDVTPPDLAITTKPTAATLAGLTTYFTARTPRDLRPAPFGDGEITETITIAPNETDWRWGDGAASGWATAATVTHAYVHGGKSRVALTTRWGATYTITYQGETFGPYNAVGQLTKQQTLTLPVRTSSPTLVSH